MPLARRTLLGSTAALATAGLLSACGSDGGGSAGAASSTGQRSIAFTFWGPDFYQKFTGQMVDAFVAKNPDVKVSLQPSEWSAYWDKLATRSAGNDAPDVINMDGKYLAEYGGRGILADLSSMKGLDLSQLSQADKDAGTFKGKLYALSTGWNAFAIFANPSLFAQAGVSIPDDKTWTWSMLMDVAKSISQKGNGVVGLTGGGTYADATIFLRQQGEDLYSDTGVGYRDETLAKWFQWHLDVAESGAGLNATKATEDGSVGYEQQAFPTNKSAMFWSWTNQLENARKSSGHSDIVMLRPPSETGQVEKNGLFLKASMFWSISSRTKQPEAAGRLVNFLMNDPAAAEIQLVARGVPSSTAALDAMASKLGDTDKYIVEWLAGVTKEITMKAPAIQPQGTADSQNSLARALQDVRFKKVSPLDAAKRVTAEVKAMVK